MTRIDPDDFAALEELWNLPPVTGSDRADEKTIRNAMFDYCYAKRDHLEHHLAQGHAMLDIVLDDIKRLGEEEMRELGKDRRKSLRRRLTDKARRIR